MAEIPPLQQQAQTFFCADAKAEGNDVCLGGWAAIDDVDPKACRWFSVRLSPATCPWLYVSGENCRLIATLEMLATLISVVLFEPSSHGQAWVNISAGTDNAGNSFTIC